MKRRAGKGFADGPAVLCRPDPVPTVVWLTTWLAVSLGANRLAFVAVRPPCSDASLSSTGPDGETIEKFVCFRAPTGHRDDSLIPP